MTSIDRFGLPLDLGDGLVLRWATSADAKKLAQFSVEMHSDNPDEPEIELYYWVLDLMSGRHPTTKASDFTLVVDTNAEDRVISSLSLISQTWRYEGIPFGVGRPELIATLPGYRRRGLVRKQIDVAHALSADRGELVNAITGIPWYYRQFGYEMAVDLGGMRQLFWARSGNSETVDEEPYRIREATADDIPILGELYRAHLGQSPIVRPRDEPLWRYELFGTHQKSMWFMEATIVETLDGRVVGYYTARQFGTMFHVRELGVIPGHSWRSVGRFVVRQLKREADALNESRPPEEQVNHITFYMGTHHPVQVALDPDLEKELRPYAWYIRVPDIPAFLRNITPALEQRLAVSVMAGHTGTLKINLYRSRFTLVWENGRLVEVGDSYEHNRLEEGDAVFPDLTFLQLLFNYRDIDDLTRSFADCYTGNNEARVLLRALFPRRPSRVIPLG